METGRSRPSAEMVLQLAGQLEVPLRERNQLLLAAGYAPSLLTPPVNVARLALHPEGLAPRIVNLGEWRGYLLGRLSRELALTGDPRLEVLLDELRDRIGTAVTGI